MKLALLELLEPLVLKAYRVRLVPRALRGLRALLVLRVQKEILVLLVRRELLGRQEPKDLKE